MVDTFGETLDKDGLTQEDRRDNGYVAYHVESPKDSGFSNHDLLSWKVAEGDEIWLPGEQVRNEIHNGVCVMARKDYEEYAEVMLDPEFAAERARIVHEIIGEDVVQPVEETVADYFVTLSDVIFKAQVESDKPTLAISFVDQTVKHLLEHPEELGPSGEKHVESFVDDLQRHKQKLIELAA